jgi:hypothetical protein
VRQRVGRVAETQVSRTRALIEAYSSTPDQQRERGEGGATDPEEREAALARALDFLDSCLRSLTDAPMSSLERPAELAAAVAPPQAIEPKHPAWRLPRGLIYWLSVGGAASVTWRLSASLLRAAIAALVASAAIILLELALRTIDPRIARRLGLARGRSDALMYGAAALTGVAGGIAIAYLV